MDIAKEKLNQLYWGEGLSTLTIGKQWGVSSTTVINKMIELGINRRTPGEYLKGHHMSEETKKKICEAQLGEKSNNWNGGVSIDAHGYRRVTLSPDSPYFAMAHKTTSRKRCRDITEHRLVMAQSLGRCLESYEVVHHINGDKLDNRLENLQLMTSMTEHMPSTNYQRYIEQVRSEAYEQGKRDILEGLKKQGLYGEYGEDYIISAKVKPDDKDWAEKFFATLKNKGWLAFIEKV